MAKLSSRHIRRVNQIPTGRNVSQYTRILDHLQYGVFHEGTWKIRRGAEENVYEDPKEKIIY